MGCSPWAGDHRHCHPARTFLTCRSTTWRAISRQVENRDAAKWNFSLQSEAWVGAPPCTVRGDNYSCQMVELIRSATFDRWLSGLRDRRAVARIAARLDRLASGNTGDVQPVGDGVSELRIHYGPGYRLYFLQRGPVLIVLLCGGDKSTQEKDITQAKALAAEWKG